MAAFKFNLEPVLHQRQAYEDQCQRNLAKAFRQRMILHHQLRQMQQNISQSKHQLTDNLVGKVDLVSTAQFARYSNQVTLRAHAFVSKLSVTEKQIQDARQRLLEATRARQALEQLRQRQYQQWSRLRDRREAARLDELATQRATRRMMAGSCS